MDIRKIKTESDYDWALGEIAQYFDHEPSPGSRDEERFNSLAARIEAYESQHWKIEGSSPGSGVRDTGSPGQS